MLEVRSLVLGDSPRRFGEDLEYVRMLADLDHKLPPILVHRQTRKVIDGAHRLRAAAMRGDSSIEVTFYDGAYESAFVEAVEANTTHGLPLSKADREAAARKIIKFFPQWSDRAIAKVTGLSAKKISSLRGDATRVDAVRIGKDGRARPLDSSAGRLRAAKLITAQPDASLSAIARSSGIAVGTVRDVREKLRRGEDPVPQSRRKNASSEADRPIPATTESAPPREAGKTFEPTGAVQMLQRDPSLRLSLAGRKLLHVVAVTQFISDNLDSLVNLLPSHCRPVLADLARNCAYAWQTFAVEVERRQDARADSNGA
ncbi:hypothetical protein FRP1_29575 (plasmid) [Pseudonocardia sp. EC080625-04]|nr:hypothetical protein FRP1_29575 [Pseudonocardia sp. EC080625-04]